MPDPTPPDPDPSDARSRDLLEVLMGFAAMAVLVVVALTVFALVNRCVNVPGKANTEHRPSPVTGDGREAH